MSKKTNILLITTDQQRFDTINASGYPHMITPHLDRLVHEGCNCINAYSPNPVCLPARHNILTGLSARWHTFDDNYFDDSHQIPYDLPTFAQVLSDQGYDTIAIGKMHFQPYRRHNGFHRLLLMDEIPRFREDDDYALYLKENGYDYLQSLHGVRHLLYMQPQQSLVEEKDHGSSWVANETIRYLDTKSKNKPFMIWAGFIAPHPPFDVPSFYADLYKEKEIPSPYVSQTPISTLAEENKNIADYPNTKTLMRARELYYSAISFVDTNVGRILAKLEEIDELDNTFVVFTSDHGEMLGDMGTYQKFLPYDTSSKIPMIIRYPKRIKAGSILDSFVDLNDLFPTFLDVANIPYSGKIELLGSSIFNSKKDRTYQYIEHQRHARRWISLRNKQYKYNYYYGGGKEELFDMIDDPHETINLLYNQKEEFDSIRCELRQKLIEYEQKCGLEGCIQNNDFVVYPDFEITFYRETNPPFFPANLAKEKEYQKLWSLEKELELAISNESIDLEKMDTAYFIEKKILDSDKLNQIIKKRKKHC